MPLLQKSGARSDWRRVMSVTPRREFLKLAFAAALAAAAVALESARARAETLGPPAPFAPENVANLARELAKSSFKAPRANLPEPFGSLNFEQYTSIRRNLGVAIWEDSHSAYALEPLHRGFIFTAPVDINLVEGGQSQRLIYDRSLYDFGKLQVPADLGDLGFSGVRILSNAGADGWKDAAIFQGATFFRSLARGQAYGVSARALSLRTGDAQGEEFPVFRALWIEKPGPGRRRARHPRPARIRRASPAPFASRCARRRNDHRYRTHALRARCGRPSRARFDVGTYLFGPLDHFHSDESGPMSTISPVCRC